MIEVGIKCGVSDFDNKKHCNSADFFEVIHGAEPDPRHRRVFDEINQMGKDYFVHLPSEFRAGSDRDQTSLNIASSNDAVRHASREIVERIIQDTSDYSPAGFVLHAPTRHNFSTKRGLFDQGSDEDFEAAMNWVRNLGKNILLENVPAAIQWGSRDYMTEPFSPDQLVASNIPLVLDTAHLFTESPNATDFITATRLLLRNVLYVHVATLREKTPHDMHGKIFAATEPEYPSIELLDDVLEMIFKISQSVPTTIRLVCEPSGNAEVHLKNHQILKDKIERLKAA